MFRLTIESVTRAKYGHQKLLADTDRATQEALEFAGRFAKDHVNKNPQFTPRTGALQAATKTRVIRTASGKLLRISNAKKYASAIDGGAKRHWIGPRNKSALRFRVGGRFVFSKGHWHPGNRPYKFLYRATDAASRALERNLKQRLSAIASRF